MRPTTAPPAPTTALVTGSVTDHPVSVSASQPSAPLTVPLPSVQGTAGPRPGGGSARLLRGHTSATVTRALWGMTVLSTSRYQPNYYSVLLLLTSVYPGSGLIQRDTSWES